MDPIQTYTNTAFASRFEHWIAGAEPHAIVPGSKGTRMSETPAWRATQLSTHFFLHEALLRTIDEQKLKTALHAGWGRVPNNQRL